MKPIAIFYHCLFYHGEPAELRESAVQIVQEQMAKLASTGLEGQAEEIVCGINGGEESRDIAKWLLPAKARLQFHGLDCRNECLTLVELENWLPSHPDWLVLYFHAKGCTHPGGDPLRTNWRNCLMRGVLDNWRTCVVDLEAGCDSVGSHWMPGQVNGTQNIWAGNFWWGTSNFLLTLPSIYLRDRIHVSGIKSVESRYEAEVWIGNGPRLPKVKDYHQVPFNCHVTEP